MPEPRKVFWSDAEKVAIVVRAVELREQKLYESPLHILRDAMKVLPPDRRRQVRSLADVPWFQELMAQALRDRRERRPPSDPFIPVMREIEALHRQVFGEMLAELRKQTQIFSTLIDKISPEP